MSAELSDVLPSAPGGLSCHRPLLMRASGLAGGTQLVELGLFAGRERLVRVALFVVELATRAESFMTLSIARIFSVLVCSLTGAS